MTYSIIGILSSVILLVINRDVLWRTGGKAPTITERNYRSFLFGVLSYYVTDAFWGILDALRWTRLQFLDTSLYFIAMAAAVFLWTRYVVSYLAREGGFKKLLRYVGWAFLLFECAVVLLNFFRPILFWFDEEGGYHAAYLRYVTLGIQIGLFLLTSVYTLSFTAKAAGTERRRNLTVGLFGIAMIALIAIQTAFPLMPFYAMGYLLGTCVLHSFVVEDKKDEYRLRLEEALAREKEQKQELSDNREALKEALAAAENANKAKTAFLSNMSHEIRTPMNAIIGLDNIALADPDLHPATKEHLEKIGDSARHLLGIINDILDMSRIESGRMTIKSEAFSFAKTLGQVNTMIHGQCADKGLRYECRLKGDVQDSYIGDDMKLRQVLINILGNAVKFTPTGGSVTMDVEPVARFQGKTTLQFTIRDTGIGMSKEFLPKLFDAFTQEDSSSTSKYGSTGLGMPITKSIVELMNGEIRVKSEKGVGTTFTVTVTLSDAERREEASPEVVRLQDMCVLVIDDDPVACEHAQIVLGQVGIRCETALSGGEGLEKAQLRYARREPYDLVLVDWKMPDMDGLETSRRIRAMIGDEPPIIILTSYSWDDIADEAKLAGVDTFVSKPLFAGQVIDEFREAFARRNAKLVDRTTDLKGKRVLLAEDMPVNAEIMLMVLSMREMEADLAENGRIAVERFAAQPEGYYDAILMDLRMPEMDGLEATRAIRAMDRPDAKRVPIIALTANAFDEDVQLSMQAGMNAHLSKPVEPEALFSTLEDLIGRQGGSV